MSWTIPSADWAMAAVPVKASTALTGVDVGSFTATWRDGGTFIAWQSGYQPDTIGFYVYRSNGGGERTQLNANIIAGGALAGTLSTFSWTDETAGWNGDVSYWIKEVKLDGSATWYGPASPVPPPAKPSPLRPGARRRRDAVDALGAARHRRRMEPGCGQRRHGRARLAVRGQHGRAPRRVRDRGAPDPLGAHAPVSARGRRVERAAAPRRRWLLPAPALRPAARLWAWAPRHAGAAGGVAVDTTATATGASGLTFSHTMSAAANGLLVVAIVTPVSCTDTTTDSGSCGACGTTCALDTTSLSSGLLDLWHFDEGSGATSFDSSGNSNTASLVGSPSWTTGYEQYAVQGNGTTGYVQGRLGSWFGGNNTLTASAWVYATANTNGPVFGVSAIPAGGTWNMPFLSIQGGASTSTVYGYVWNNTPLAATVTNNAWHLLTLTYDPSGSSTKFYVDGALSQTGTGTYSASGTTDYWTTNIGGAKPSGVNSYPARAHRRGPRLQPRAQRR